MRNGFSGCSDCKPNFSLPVKCGRLGARHDGQRWSVLDTYDDLGEHNAIFVVANFVITFHLIKGNWATLKGWVLMVKPANKIADQDAICNDIFLPISCSGRSTGTIDLKLRGWHAAPWPINPSR